MNSTAFARVPWRLAILGGISCLLYVLGSVWQPPLERANHPWYFLWFSGVFAVYLLALLAVHRQNWQVQPGAVALIVGWALIFRVSVLWVTPGFLSDDIYRYSWDGLVQQAGINPYNYPPDASELGILRDDTIFPMINRQVGADVVSTRGTALFPSDGLVASGQPRSHESRDPAGGCPVYYSHPTFAQASRYSWLEGIALCLASPRYR